MYIESGDVARSVEHRRDAPMDELEPAGLEGTDEHIRLSSVLVSGLVERGDLLFATRHSRGAHEVADRVGSSRARGSVYWNAAAVAQSAVGVLDAIRLTDRAVALLGEQEESRDLPRLRMHYAWVLLNNRRSLAPAEALDQLDRAAADPSLAGSRLDLGIGGHAPWPRVPAAGPGRRRRGACRRAPCSCSGRPCTSSGSPPCSSSGDVGATQLTWTWPWSRTRRPSGSWP